MGENIDELTCGAVDRSSYRHGRQSEGSEDHGAGDGNSHIETVLASVWSSEARSSVLKEFLRLHWLNL